MVWLMIGYMYLFIHRPFEIWAPLGAIRLELLYALFTFGAWLMYGDKRWLTNPLQRAFLVFIFVTVVCWAASPWADKGYDAVDKFIKQTFFFFLLVTVVQEVSVLNRIGQAYVVIMTIYMLHSLLEFTHGRFHHRMEITRLIGVDVTISDPNALGATLVYSICLTPALWYVSNTARWRGFLIFYGLLTAGCVALTGSRSAFASLLLWVVLTILRSRWRYAFGALALAAAPLVWAALPHELQNRFETIINPDAGPLSAKVSAEGRLQGLQLGLKLFEEYPLTGCGPGVWTHATRTKLQAHNLYGQVLGELGILGTLAFAAVLVCFWVNVRHVKRLYREHSEWGHDILYQYAACLGTAVLLLLVNGNFAHSLFRYHWLWYGAFLIIVRHCVERRAQESAEFGPEDAAAEGEDDFAPGWDGGPSGLAPGGSHA